MEGLQLTSPLLLGKSTNSEYLIGLASRVGLDRKYVETEDIVRELSKVRMDLLINATYSDKFRLHESKFCHCSNFKCEFERYQGNNRKCV